MDINSGVNLFRKTPGAVLLDVRTPQEYAERHIEGSINIPLQVLGTSLDRLPDKNAVIFVHCLSGGRSGVAVSFLQRSGYVNVTNIGGIKDYTGE